MQPIDNFYREILTGAQSVTLGACSVDCIETLAGHDNGPLLEAEELTLETIEEGALWHSAGVGDLQALPPSVSAVMHAP